MGAPPLTPPAAARACIYCSAWRAWGDIAQVDDRGRLLGRLPLGQCRANPPTIDPSAIGDSNAAWPCVEATDWCRSFVRRPADIAPAERQPGGRLNDEGVPRT